MVDAWSNVIEDDDGLAAFRLGALVAAAGRDASILDELEQQVREKDTQLQELQHRVKNNLQMITALIRVEARGVSDLSTSEGFDRLAGRVEALGLLYPAPGHPSGEDVVDLGVYLSEIASAVMRAHAVEGIHLDLQVDTWMVSVDVAMPTGLVVNELLTNSLKHAFQGRDGGTGDRYSPSARKRPASEHRACVRPKTDRGHHSGLGGFQSFNIITPCVCLVARCRTSMGEKASASTRIACVLQGRQTERPGEWGQPPQGSGWGMQLRHRSRARLGGLGP